VPLQRELVEGNEAIAEAAIKANCRFFFGYPITPQTEILEYMAKRLPQVGGFFMQAESEIAAISMVQGVACTGARVMTATSSPGISLMQEGISCLASMQLPCVIVNVTRASPGLGRIPPDLDIKPYRDEHDSAVLKSMQQVVRRELAARRRQ